MAAVKHTAGPWEAGEYGNSFIVTAKERQYDVAVVRNIGNEDNEANAHLIAAAPDLLDELRVARAALADFTGLTEPHAHSLARRFEALIAKATNGGA